MKMILKIFEQNFCLGQMDHFGLRDESNNMKDESNNNGFCQKKYLCMTIRPFCASKMAHPHNSGSTLNFFLKFRRVEGANRYIKIFFVVF